jgi:hypothetical protein
MSILSSDNRPPSPPSRRNVLLGLAACSLPAPAIVRVSSLMPVRRVLITDNTRPWAGYVERLFYNALAADLRRGRITVGLNGNVLSLPEAQRLVSVARRNGWIYDHPARLPTS